MIHAIQKQLPRNPAARALALASLVDWMGTGVWLTTSVLFLVQTVGLSSADIGIGLGIAGVLGMLAVIPVADLTRRWPAGRVAVLLQVARGLAFLSYLAVVDARTFFVAAALVGIADRPTITVNQIVVARVVPDAERSAAMAAAHVAQNVGISVGALLGTLALLRTDRSVFVAVVLINAATYFLAAWVMARTVWSPEAEAAPVPARAGTVRTLLAVLRDWRFTVLTVGNGLLALHVPLLTVATPLWLAQATDVPLAAMGALLIVNTALVVLFQMPLARPVRSVTDGVRAAWISAGFLIACCVALALSPLPSVPVAVGLFVVAVALQTMGEIQQNAAGWALSFNRSPTDHRQSTYLGLFGTGQTVVTLLGPTLLTFLIAFLGAVSFAAAAALFLVGALCVTIGAAGSAVVESYSPGR
ncbi:MFS transporter [Nonomuraea sp. NPDC005983]|uniref:MFS transporter n=1 Tax=Nonomuraea sp. NPDC005983 TaxID=3155595 RepID=UPI0033A18FF6